MNLIEELEKLEREALYSDNKMEDYIDLIRRDKAIAIVKKHMLTKRDIGNLMFRFGSGYPPKLERKLKALTKKEAKG